MSEQVLKNDRLPKNVNGDRVLDVDYVCEIEPTWDDGGWEISGNVDIKWGERADQSGMLFSTPRFDAADILRVGKGISAAPQRPTVEIEVFPGDLIIFINRAYGVKMVNGQPELEYVGSPGQPIETRYRMNQQLKHELRQLQNEAEELYADRMAEYLA